ncbi:MAG: arginine--tRNA ligase [Betaproteobacteria bacterium]|nr:MAG: arginine--tRNA ligase [Betaproteobacteria bacterium]
MTSAADLRAQLVDLLQVAVANGVPQADAVNVVLERPKSVSHGDYACNVAMQLAKPLRRNPREIAQSIVSALPDSPLVRKAEVAGAGFINLFLDVGVRQNVVPAILDAGAGYGRIAVGDSRKVQVEFVSANPTGPLHVGHGRGAAYGASLANVLDAAGYAVTREYYVNDAGRQMDILALSTWLRYLQIEGQTLSFPENAYQGNYVRDMARAIQQQHGARYVHACDLVFADVPPAAADSEAHLDALIANAKTVLGPDYAYIHDFVLTEQLGDCRNDLLEFGVEFDVWYSEKSLYDSGMVATAMDRLRANGHLYQQDGAVWFRSTAFGDEKDRVVQRDNGQYTYFASDVAYHANKLERGFDKLIDVWGADHHGYIARVRGALAALGEPSDRLTVALVQFAVLYRGGQKASMSTRSGEFVTLRELRQEVGNDAARFFYVLRKSDQHLDFDLDLAKSQSNENPVYYIQYGHARCSSVLEKWGGNVALLVNADVSRLVEEDELVCLQKLLEFPEVIEVAARDLAPHMVAFYLRDLAAAFHSYYNSTQILIDDSAVREARLSLVASVQQVLRNGLALLGVSAPDKM